MAKQSNWTDDLRSLGSGTHRTVRDLLKELDKDGEWRGRRTGSNHILLVHKDGRSTLLPSTPSDHRTMLNCMSDLRRKVSA